MNEIIQRFLRSINERGHILQLVTNKELAITIVCGQQTNTIGFKNGTSFIPHTAGDPAASYYISGEMEAIKQLLEGKETLRYLVRKGWITISAPFRTILLLEAIFYLTKSDENFQKIIS